MTNPDFNKSFPCKNIAVSRKDVADVLTNNGMILRDAYVKASELTDEQMGDIVETFENIFFDDGYGEYQTILLKSFKEIVDGES